MGHPSRVLLRKAICEYTRQHPEASDTAEGILGWWVPAPGFDGAALILDDILADLVADGVLRTNVLPDGSVLYSAGTAPKRRDD